MNKLLPLAVIVLLSVAGAAADCLVKVASKESQSIRSPWLWVGAATYFLTAFAWVYVLRHVKLSLIGVVYSYCTVAALILVGVVVFDETLDRGEVLGIVLGFISIGLLGRFF